MNSTGSFHNYERRLVLAIKRMQKHDFRAQNKELVLEHHHYLSSTGMSVPRLITYLMVLRKTDKIMKKSFRDVEKADIIEFINYIQSQGYSVWTVQMYKVVIKKFFMWLDEGEKASIVDWIVVHVRRKDVPVKTEGDLITEEEYKKMLTLCNKTRDKALLSLLFESGARIGEIGTLRLRDVTIDDYGVILTVKGKTGTRQIRVIESTQYLLSWLDNHPDRNNRDAPLWTQLRFKKIKIVNYPAIRKLLTDIAKRAGIKKRVHPHLFRHSRATIMANHLTEFQMNSYFGWEQGSDMPSTYVHLSGRDIDEALLDFHGIKKEEKEKKITAKKCPRCEFNNPHTVNNCIRCAGFLDQKAVFEEKEFQKQKQEVKSKADTVLNSIMKDPEIQEMILKKLKENGQLAEVVKI